MDPISIKKHLSGAAPVGTTVFVHGWVRTRRDSKAGSSRRLRLGFERLVAHVTGLGNIRDAIPYPRAPKLAEF